MDRSHVAKREEVEQLLTFLDSYTPAIPDELVRHYLSEAGFQTDDVRIERLIALAGQKFIADIANDAISYSRLRHAASQGGSRGRAASAAAKAGKITLTTDDLEKALREYGVNLQKPKYFADAPANDGETMNQTGSGAGNAGPSNTSTTK